MRVPARWWRPLENKRVQCTLCPRNCKIGNGQSGFCYIRHNTDGELFLTAYGRPIGLHVDPVEKKPLYHFLPGSGILSFGTIGCNLGCKFCQNWDMSMLRKNEHRTVNLTPEQIVQLALDHHCPSIAYTYNEPIIFAEFMIDVARLAHKHGLRNVMVTNGYVTKEAREDVFEHIDAANVDLKAFSREFYFRLTAAQIDDVLDNIIWLVNETDVWIELTNLIIPDFNDQETDLLQLINWVLKNCGKGVPVHFSAFHPAYKMSSTKPTSPETVIKARQLALDNGLQYVYTGNISDHKGSETHCPQCNRLLIERTWSASATAFLNEGKCVCGERLPGIYK